MCLRGSGPAHGPNRGEREETLGPCSAALARRARGGPMNPIPMAPPTQDYSSPAESAVEPDDPRVLAALEEYLAGVEAGRPLDRLEFLHRHSTISPALRKAMEGLGFIKEIGCHLGDPG